MTCHVCQLETVNFELKFIRDQFKTILHQTRYSLSDFFKRSLEVFVGENVLQVCSLQND